ncbi:MAG TPA: tetratricopeptide repeat protein, partial [Paracoccaceae bacterium]|nr:tetratricopeptide repeat protein [Paracoccaceae bacterium]
MRWVLLSLVLVLGMPSGASAQLLPGALDALSPEARAAHAEARALREKGDWAAALDLAGPVLAEAIDRLGSGHATTVELAIAYGTLLDNMDRGAEALAHFERLFAEVKQNFTEWSPFYAAVEIRYADMLAKEGRHAEALPIALGVTRRVGGMIGADQTTTATFLQEAATILRRMGYLEEALDAYRRITPIYERDGAARQVAQALFLQGDVLDRMGRFDEAYAVYAEADTRATAVFGLAHHETLAIRLARARTAFAVGDMAGLAQILDSTLPVVVTFFGEGSLQHGTWLRLLAWQQADAARNAEAGLETMARAVEMVARALPDTHRVTGETRSDYAAILASAGRHDQAWEQYELAEPAAGFDRKFMLDVLSFRQEKGSLDEVSLVAAVLPHLQRIAGGQARGAVREQVLRQLIRDPEAGRLYREATDMVEERVRVEADIAAVASRPLAEADPAREVDLRARLAG